VKDTLGIDMKLLNIGGGFPAYNYYNTVPEIDLYIDTINQ
jgi:diaminopimelate decarboxylase